MPPTELASVIAEAHRVVVQHPDGYLALPWRRRIRAAFGPLGDSPATVGWTRRWHLALRCAERALSRWRFEHPDDRRPVRVIDLAATVFAGDADPRDAATDCSQFLHDIVYAPEQFSVHAYFAANAVAALVRVAAVGDYGADLGPDTLDEDLVPEAWDIEGLTAAAEASVPGDQDDNPVHRRDFWRWYLHEAVPAAYAAGGGVT